MDIKVTDYGSEIYFGGEGQGLIVLDRNWHAGGLRDIPNAWDKLIAQAKLFSAAPDLLSALLAITNSGPDAIPIKEAFEMAHRAIERARGDKV